LPGAETINNFGVALRGEKFPFLVDLNERQALDTHYLNI
jgi:hypothetical protein